VLASQLASRQIGLASEPVSAGDELAPPRARPESERHDTGESRPIEDGEKTTAPATTAPSEEREPATTVEPPAPVEPPATSETTESSKPSDDSTESRGSEGGGGHGDD
jgi:hypothetical protein